MKREYPRWVDFAAKARQSPQDQFENLCRMLFCEENKIDQGSLVAIINQPGNETEVFKKDDGSWIGFQSKYFKVRFKVPEFKESIEKAKRYNPHQDTIFLYSNQTPSERQKELLKSECKKNGIKPVFRFDIQILDQVAYCDNNLIYDIFFNLYLEQESKSNLQPLLSNATKLHPQAIVLGLPSGTRWASCNIGAANPEMCGEYYAWGETQKKKNYFDQNTYILNKESKDTCINSRGDISGTEYDVAHVVLGGNWRMPTKEDFRELLENCSNEWTIINGVKGCMFKSKINGNSIFLPAAGRYVRGNCLNYGKRGYYWSSTPNSSNTFFAYDLFFDCDKDKPESGGDNYCYHGRQVRPVFKAWTDTNEALEFSTIIKKLAKNRTNEAFYCSRNEAALTVLSNIFKEAIKEICIAVYQLENDEVVNQKDFITSMRHFLDKSGSSLKILIIKDSPIEISKKDGFYGMLYEHKAYREGRIIIKESLNNSFTDKSRNLVNLFIADDKMYCYEFEKDRSWIGNFGDAIVSLKLRQMFDEIFDKIHVNYTF